jgi:hypothetical protein
MFWRVCGPESDGIKQRGLVCRRTGTARHARRLLGQRRPAMGNVARPCDSVARRGRGDRSRWLGSAQLKRYAGWVSFWSTGMGLKSWWSTSATCELKS